MGQRGDKVTVAPYCLDVTEVTVKAYAACVRKGQCRAAGDLVDGPRAGFLVHRSEYCNANRGDRQDHPVNCVDWHQAATYCKSVGRRLQTEEEWEWAARGGTQDLTYPWGEEEPRRQLCWSGPGNDRGEGFGTCPVGKYPRGDSPFGVKDLAGNVKE